MGIQAVHSHAKSKKHLDATNAAKKSVDLKTLFKLPNDAPSAVKPLSVCTSSATGSSKSAITVESSSSSGSRYTGELSSASPSAYVMREDAQRAEILWCLHLVKQGLSYNSCSTISELFPIMFPDSPIASKFSMGRDKAAYIVSFGLAPYFKTCLDSKVQKSDCLTICFDESLNGVSQRSQMDLIVRYFDKEMGQVQSAYYASAFLGHTKADDLLNAFNEATTGLDLSKLKQVSMDGPNVNFLLLDKLSTQRATNSEPALMRLGSCGLHVIHNSFQRGHAASTWQVNSLLSAVYYLFKDSPARRNDFTTITGSSQFGKKFCHIRWCENVDVVERVIIMLPYLKKYCDTVKPKPVVASFTTVSSALKDPLLLAKLEFFKLMALQVLPFLRKFQSSKPMVPFLYDNLMTISRDLVVRIVKPSAIDASSVTSVCNSIAKDRDEPVPIYKTVKDIDIGFGADRELKKCTVPQQQKVDFRSACQSFIKAMLTKIMERSPLNCPVVRHLSSFHPHNMRLNDNGSPVQEHRFKSFINAALDCQQLTCTIADKAFAQYKRVCECPLFNSQAKDFDPVNHRLDTFFSNFFSTKEEYKELWDVIVLVMVLSHGNATVSL
jgi:hypothetical protein